MTEDGQNVFLPAGTKVARTASFLEADSDDLEGRIRTEYGVVVHCWLDEHGFYNCYIAFFNFSGFPKGKPRSKPYILRYWSMSLRVVG
jgi:hypothetical protein